MSYSLRKPGSQPFLTIEVWALNGIERWSPINGMHIFAVPKEKRFPIDAARTGAELEPYQSFSASGEVWQQTGNHGFHDNEAGEELALRMIRDVAKANPGKRFRIVRVNVTIEVSQLATYSTGVEEELSENA